MPYFSRTIRTSRQRVAARSPLSAARYLWDAVAQKPVRTYGAEVGYRLTGTTNDGNRYCKKWIESPINTTIALSYNPGTDMMTFVKQDVYRVSLKFAY